MTPDRLEQVRRVRAEEISFSRIGEALGVSEITVLRAQATNVAVRAGSPKTF